jgi:hypothetical protein
MNYQEVVNALLTGQMPLSEAQRRFPERAGDLAGMAPKPRAPQGGSSSQGINMSKRELLEGLVLGRFQGPARPKAAWQSLQSTMSEQGFDQDALAALMKMQSSPRQIEGAPPAPFRTQFQNKADLLSALLGGDVAPQSRPKAAETLLGRQPNPQILEGLLAR